MKEIKIYASHADLMTTVMPMFDDLEKRIEEQDKQIGQLFREVNDMFEIDAIERHLMAEAYERLAALAKRIEQLEKGVGK